MNKKELVIGVIELASKALHKNKAFTRIRLFCGGDQLMKQRFNYGLGLKRASLNSIKAFFCHFGKILSFFCF
ncbi:hypothetical protein [Helicobacter pylori]|uniref:hypothetical protein n=1 Tax=Helicobacter pylori TaxID=210 RepID=UPI000674DA7D|nr:hypothetical protein [Helicobacter pylori]KNE07650.1 hypothetical protein ACM25_04525 [Helicobacter pylori]MBM2777699.1 hypothetical protein [Helicobacter pylori]WRB84269.1 hypothetical protein KVE46_01565 [Helicobacter pylori]WRC33496.1 hypothetical protein KVD89_01720 [Helicobacter pylori]WRE05163.1 hypothetical protein KVB97_01730 [Helicobacter pylori]